MSIAESTLTLAVEESCARSAFAFSFRAAALAAAICCRSADEEAPAAFGDTPSDGSSFALVGALGFLTLESWFVPLFTAGLKASCSAGLAFEGRAAIVLLFGGSPKPLMPVAGSVNTGCFDGEGDRGRGGTGG